MAIPKDKAEQWTRFWQQGFITTFGAAKANNYDGAVRQFWLDTFSSLGHGARILDIATGNGAVATLAAGAGRDSGKDFFVAGTDIAEIGKDIRSSPELLRLRESIAFHGRTPCERQPFEDGYFDLVTSQFGFEYSDQEKTLVEVWRVLRPGGRFAAISHHAESSLIRDARRELEIYNTALDELDLFGRLEAYFEAAGALDGTGEELARALRAAKPQSQKINAAVDEIRRRYPTDACTGEMVAAVGHLVRSARGMERSALMAEIHDARREFVLARARLADMAAAALEEIQLRELKQQALAGGNFAQFAHAAFRGDDGELAGWQVEMTKS